MDSVTGYLPSAEEGYLPYCILLVSLAFIRDVLVKRADDQR